MHRFPSALTAAALTLLSGLASAATPPAGFQESIVFSGLNFPTAVRFLPDGRVLVAEKSGLIKVFASLTATTPTVVADLRTNVHNFWDRGLLGLAVDPDFDENHFIYVLYTHDAAIGGVAPRWGVAGATSDGCPSPPGATTDGCVVSSRLSRLQMSDDIAGPEQVLIEDWCQQFPSHSTGGLAFGADGMLYVTGGDGASFLITDYGQRGGSTGSPTPRNPCGDPPAGVGGVQTPPTAEGGALRAQSVRRPEPEPVTLNGAILRLDPATGAAAPDNPFAGDPDANARRIVGYGLRNPFRFTIKPGTNELWIGDVGWGLWEEIDRIPDPLAPTVGNYGWPCYEGVGKHAGYDGANLNLCETLYAQPGVAISPFFTYAHSESVVPGDGCTTGSSSISGLTFYNGGSYPSSYQGALFFSDYSRKCIWVMFADENGTPDPATRMAWKSAAAGPVALEAGPNGDIFYVDFDGGKIRRYRYLGPTAIATATPLQGSPPLQVTFDASGSEPGQPGDTLVYAWDLDGDGLYDDSTLVSPEYTYAALGSYTASLRVTDNHGVSTLSSPLTIDVAESAPTAVIETPLTSLTWKVGDPISFSGFATDPQDGDLPASALTWSVIVHHCPSNCHTHVYQTFSGVSAGGFPAPDHDYPSHLEIQLVATDSQGLSSVASVHLEPQTVNLTYQTSPPGLELTVGPDSAATPFSRTVIVGSDTSISAPTPQGSWVFSSWSDGGAQSHNIVAPPAPATYTATFTSPSGLPPPWVNRDIGTVGAAGSASYAGTIFTGKGAGSDIWGISDSFQFIYQPLVGDATIVARVVTQQNTNAWAKTGVMIREALTPKSIHAFMAITPTSGLAFQRRLTTGASSVTTVGGAGAAPYWLKLTRAGNTFTASKSPDGIAWTIVDSINLPMSSTAYVGLAVCSHKNGTLATSTFDNVSISLGTPNAPPSASITSPLGGATYTSPASIDISASASDTDGSIARVDFYADGNLLGSSSLAPYGFAWPNVGPGTYSLTARATDNSNNVTASAPVSVTVNASGGGALPAPWVNRDIGTVGAAGSASYADPIFTGKGAGSDIWGISDSFHFVYQPLVGDATIVARVLTQQNTNPWAKSGVMIREALTPKSIHAFMAITPTSGLAFQRRLTTGASSVSTVGGPGAAPHWLKLTRAGNTFTASRSPDGIVWTVVDSITFPMSSTAYVGLAVCSHKNGFLATTTFDNVSISSP